MTFLQVEHDVPEPTPGPHDVVVEVHASAINPVDWKIREGRHADLVDLPLTLGWDVAGTVVRTGEAVTKVEVGDAVFARPELTGDGAQADYACVAEDALAIAPASLSATEAAAVPLAGLTAWQALFDQAGLQEGERVLVQGAAGGVGHLAVQLAHHAHAYVIGTASARNHDWLRELGADELVDYHDTDVADAVDEVDVVFDTVGGTAEEQSMAVLREGGRLVAIAQQPDHEEAARRGIEASWFLVSSDGDQLAELGRLVDDDELTVRIREVMPLDEVARAHELSESGHADGKIVLEVAAP